MAERTRKRLPISAVIATIPLMIVSVGVYVFGIGLSVYFSFTNTVVFPDYNSSDCASTSASGRRTSG